MRRLASVALIGSLVTGCATYEPIIDPKGVDQARYRQDLAECQALARQVSPAREALGGALLGAAAGTALGAVTGAAVGSPGKGAAIGAGAGGLTGAGVGAAGGAEGQAQVVQRCLSGRGYRVLR